MSKSHVKKQKEVFDNEFSRIKKYTLENWQKRYLKKIEQIIEKYVKEERNMNIFLDIGCGGIGYVCNELGKKYYTVGIDFSYKSIENCVKFSKELNVNSHFLQANAEMLPFRDESFNFVSIIAVLDMF